MTCEWALIHGGTADKARQLALCEIEALPDRAGFVKFASAAAWNFVQFAYYDVRPG